MLAALDPSTGSDDTLKGHPATWYLLPGYCLLFTVYCLLFTVYCYLSSDFLAELDEHAVGAFGVHKAHELVVGSLFRHLAQQAESFFLEPGHLSQDIAHLEGNVVDAFPAGLQVFAYGAVLAQ